MKKYTKYIQTPSHWIPIDELKKWIKENKKQLKENKLITNK